MNMFSNSVNTIITNNTVVDKILSLDENIEVRVNPTFVLTSKDVVDEFSNEVTNKGLNENYQVTTNLDQLSNETSSISNLKTFSITFLVITIIIGGIVLFIINMINLRERKYEIGVLRTIGMKKSEVILQFVCELLMVTIIGLAIGGLIGSVLSVPTSNKLLEQEINSAQESRENINNNFGDKGRNRENMPTRGVSKISEFTSIDATVDLKVLVELFGIGILLSIISSSASMINISRFSPLSILKERS